MAAATSFGGGPAQFGYDPATTMDLQQVTAFDLQANSNLVSVRSLGSVDPVAHVLTSARPIFNLRTPDLATLLGVLDFSAGKCFDEASTFWLVNREDCGEWNSANVHLARTVAKGFMYIDEISASGEENAELAEASCVFVPLSVLGAVPVVKATAQTLASMLTVAYVSGYHLGGVVVNGTELKRITRVSIRPQIQFEVAPAYPDAFAAEGTINERDWEVGFTSEAIAEITAAFTGGVQTNVDVYLQKADSTNANGNGRLARAAASHIKITFATVFNSPQSEGSEGSSNTTNELVLKSVGAPTVATASAMPAMV